jgi:hypothetical protein
LVTWNCQPTPGTPCSAGTGLLLKPDNAVAGSIKLKVQPDQIDTGKRFPVVVTKT